MTMPLPLPGTACFCTATFFCGGAPCSAPVAAATPKTAIATTASNPTTATLLGEPLTDNFILPFLSLGGRRENGSPDSGLSGPETPRHVGLGNNRLREVPSFQSPRYLS